MHNDAAWSTERLGDHAYIKARIGWRGLASSEYTAEGPYLIAGNHIRGGRVHWPACDHISMYRYQESREIALKESDLILTKDGTIGRVAMITALPGLATINGTMMLVRTRPPLVPQYVYHYLTGEAFQRLVADKVSGSSIPHIFQRDMVELTIPIPSVPEQRRIADILDTVDAAIQQTEALIAKLKQMKAGLLHDLLTRGLDAHGHLRDPVAHPEQFQDSPLGRIPKVWRAERLQSLLSSPITDFGSFSMTNLLDFQDSGVPFLRTEAIFDQGIAIEQLTFISERVHKLLFKSVVHPGDILFTKIGVGLGRVCVYDGSLGECNSNAASAKIRLAIHIADRNFLAYYLRSHLAKRQYLSEVISTPPRVNLGQLNAMKILVPPLSEQQDIAAILDAHQARIYNEEAYLSKLKQLKKGLMADLLTGRVRVSPDEIAAP